MALAAVLVALTAAPAAADSSGNSIAILCRGIHPANGLYMRVDREHGLPRDFAPHDIVPVTLPIQNARLDRTIELRGAAAEPLLDLLRAANQSGLRLTVVSGYRSYTDQVLAFQKWAELYPDRVDSISARPGHSEHQLGVAVDFGTPDPYYTLAQSFARTPEAGWLQVNAAKFGFVLSYPAWAEGQTGYSWEPWHYRYVGAPLAQKLEMQRLTLGTLLSQCARMRYAGPPRAPR